MIVERARACLGARFRVHGRDPASGLDCVGLVAFALDRRDVPSGYALRGGDAERVRAMIVGFGLAPVKARRAGDLLLFASGPGQLHLGIWSGDGLIHACAQARRVVERPGAPPWRQLGCWRKETSWRR